MIFRPFAVLVEGKFKSRDDSAGDDVCGFLAWRFALATNQTRARQHAINQIEFRFGKDAVKCSIDQVKEVPLSEYVRRRWSEGIAFYSD